MTKRPFGAFLASLAIAGCSPYAGAGTSEPPAPYPVPEIRVEPAELGPMPEVGYLSPPPGNIVADPILSSPVMRDPEFRESVAWWVDYWSGAARRAFPDFLARMSVYEQTVDSTLADRGLPPSLRYLPLIESGYNPSARSRASAVGMWQFMSGTARELGLHVGPFVDERRSPWRSTEAAVQFLDELHTAFDSWFLVLAAYNGGPNRARRILREHAPLAQPSDSLFWALRQHWPRETRDFVPKLVGAIIVAGAPERYGYERPTPLGPNRFDEVEVPDATTVDVLASAAGVDEQTMRSLNPELFRGFTPPGRSWRLRVPEGRGRTFEETYASIPKDRRMTVVEHAVEPGETLSHIARRYGVTVSDLEAANPEVRPRYLRVGARLTVPILLGRGGA